MIKNIIKALGKSVSIPLELTAAASTADVKLITSTTTTLISNDKVKALLEIVKYLQDSDLLLKGVSKTIQYKAKKQKGEFLSIILGTLDASLLGNLLAGIGINRAVKWTIRKSVSKKIKSETQGRGII